MHNRRAEPREGGDAFTLQFGHRLLVPSICVKIIEHDITKRYLSSLAVIRSVSGRTIEYCGHGKPSWTLHFDLNWIPGERQRARFATSRTPGNHSQILLADDRVNRANSPPRDYHMHLDTARFLFHGR